MSNPRKSWLFTLCVGTVVIFFAQTMLCFADDAGIIPCAHQSAQHDAGSSQQSSGGDPITHCGHSHSHELLLVVDSAGLVVPDLLAGVSFNANGLMPESPVREIEYPPQLS
jgi:hypothetical protein